MVDRSAFSAALWATAAVAAQNTRSDVSDELRRTLSFVASTCILQMIMSAGPEVGALFAAFEEYERQQGTSQEFTSYASELTDRRAEVPRPDKQRPAPIDDVLTPREMSIVELIGRGHSNKEIARGLGIGPETVKTHMKHVFAKLGVERRAQAVLRAHALGLTGADASISVSYDAL
jgi:LuxR family maltose regulon positive regulatory protein